MPRDVVVMLDGYRLRLRRRDAARIVDAHTRPPRHPQRASAVHRQPRARPLPARVPARARRRPPSSAATSRVRRPAIERAAARRRRRGRRGRPGPGRARRPTDWEQELTDAPAPSPEVRAALERMWPVLSGAELVNDLFGFAALIRSAADGVLTDARAAAAASASGRPTSPTSRGPTPTSPLVDEADALLGPAERGAAPRPPTAPERRRRSRCARRTVAELGVGGSVERRAGAGALRQRRARRSTDDDASRARSATCSSTRRRTSPRCSGGCSPAAARRGP